MSKIMIVDDEKDVRFSVGKMLENAGYNVVEAEDGADCLEKIKEDKPDLVLLDIMMPDMSGWDVLNKLQGDRDLKSVPVTMFSVKPLTSKTLEKKGVDVLIDYISKPFSKKDFLESIEDIFNTITKIEETKIKLATIDIELGDRYEKLLKTQRLHQNLVSMVQGILAQRKADGSMDDIQSFEDVIKSEIRHIESINEELKSIEEKIDQN